MVPSPLSIINFKEWREDLPQWKILGKVIFCSLILPAFCLFLLLEWIGWQLGATLSPERAADIQATHPNMIWYGYRTSTFARFKLERVAQERPDILIFGQSRPQMFRSAMFRPYTEYNLGSLSYTMASFTDLLHQLPAGYNPKVIILACDFYMFDPLCTAINVRKNMLQDFTPPPFEHLDDLRDLFVLLPNHPVLLSAGVYHLRSFPTVGISAYLYGMGFRFDGSTRWFRHTDDPDLANETPWGDVSMIQGDSLGTAELAQFEQFVSEAHARGIAVVFLQMPMYKPFVDKMEITEKEKYGILADFRSHIAQGYFKHLGVPAFDLLTMPGSDDYHYFLDIVHPKEGLTLQVMNTMASDPEFRELLPKLDFDALNKKAQAERLTNHDDVYGDQFNDH